MTGTEQFETRSKIVRGRGMAQKSLNLIATMHDIAEATQPITGRGIGYKLFTRKLIRSMKKKNMQRVYRLLKEARERGLIPWSWIVDETREIERQASWNNPADFVATVKRAYRQTSGINSRFAWWWSVRKAPCAVYLPRCSTNWVLASCPCMVSAVRPQSMTWLKITMAAR